MNRESGEMDENKKEFSARLGVPEELAQAALSRVRARLAQNEAEGIYTRFNLAQRPHPDLAALNDRTDFYPHLARVLKRSWDTDIGDFEIKRRKGLCGTLEYTAKKTVWALMKFYTFRMFSQTKAYNLQAATALASLARRLDRIEKRLDGKENG